MKSPVPLPYVFTVTFGLLFLGVADRGQSADLPETAPNFLWAVQAGGPMHDKTRGLATDAAGNVYMTGEFGKTGTFGDLTVESKGDLDFFVAKYSPEGKCLWVKTGGGSKVDRGYAVAVDAQGNVFATGHYQSEDADFDGVKLENRGNYDFFIVKYDKNGKLLWVKSAGGTGYDYGHGIGVDKAGNCYVTGALVGDYDFLGTTGKNGGGGHEFLAKISPDGNLAWLQVAGGTGGCEGESLSVDPDGNTVVAGSASGVVTVGDKTLTNKNGRDALAVKYDTNGKVLWTFTGDGSKSALFASVAQDSHGGVSLSGEFKGEALLMGGQTIEGHGDNDFIFAKLDRDGKLRWLKTGGGPKTDYALCVAADDAGNSYVTGEFQDTVTIGDFSMAATGLRDLYVAKFDDKGELRWMRSVGGTGQILGYCIVRDTKGALYISGAFDKVATFGKTTLTGKGSNDIMLLKMGN